VSDVVWAASALDDIDSIVDYIAADDLRAARKVVERIATTAERLGRMAIGRGGRVAGTYEKSVVGVPYIISYALQQRPGGQERVVILRVIHSARNWPKGKWPA
jgi:plasmid stabilization system protein ParE